MRCAFAAFIGLISISTSAFADPAAEWLAAVTGYMTEAGASLREEGYRPDGAPHVGALHALESATLSVPLPAGRDAMILGMCDNDCSDLDLAVSDPSGASVEFDAESDDAPLVPVDSARGGNYSVLVTMRGCAAEPCRFGVQVFVK